LLKALYFYNKCPNKLSVPTKKGSAVLAEPLKLTVNGKLLS